MFYCLTENNNIGFNPLRMHVSEIQLHESLTVKKRQKTGKYINRLLCG